MISDFTKSQLANLTVDAKRPLIICDVDDVVVHFLRSFDAMLAEMDHVLEANSFALNGNVVHRETRTEMPQEVVAQLVDDFFAARTEYLEAIDGAVESLLQLSAKASVVMLTNLPHHAREKRIRNLQKHGLPFPVITNSGPKGPAIKNLADRTSGSVVFVDDSPNFVKSSYEFAPAVKIVHFLHDERFARLHQPFDFVSKTTGEWESVRRHISELID
jgi:FMN phosphatase YigB (HAD superfamily)